MENQIEQTKAHIEKTVAYLQTRWKKYDLADDEEKEYLRKEILELSVEEYQLRNRLHRLEATEPSSKKIKSQGHRNITNDILQKIYKLVDRVLPCKMPPNKEKLPDTFEFETIKNILDQDWTQIFPRCFYPFCIWGDSYRRIQQNSSQNITNLFSFENDVEEVTFEFMYIFDRLIDFKGYDENTHYYIWVNDIIMNPAKWYLKKRNENPSKGFKMRIDTREKTYWDWDWNCFPQRSEPVLSSDLSQIKYSFASLRSDLILLDKYNRIGLKGENYSRQIKTHQKAKEHLALTYFPLNRDIYSAINRTFSYIATGDEVRMYFVEHKDTEVILHDLAKFDLTEMEDRLKLMVNMMIIIEIVVRMFDMYTPTDTHKIKETKTITLENGREIARIEFDCNSNTALKYFFLNDDRHDAQTLSLFYHKLDKLGPTDHLAQVFDYDFPPYKTYRIMTPIYTDFDDWKQELLVSTEEQKLKSIKKCLRHVLTALGQIHKLGFVHTDVRWPNIVYDVKTDSFRLIDFENVREIDCKCQNENHEIDSSDSNHANSNPDLEEIEETHCVIMDIAKLQELLVSTLLGGIVKANSPLLQLFHQLNNAFEAITKIKVDLPSLTSPGDAKSDQVQSSPPESYHLKIAAIEELLK